MSNPNLSAEIAPADKDKIKLDLKDVKTLLPFLVNLTPQDRHKLFKMGPKSLNFVEYALTVAEEHPGIMPVDFSFVEFKKDFTLTRDLNEIAIISEPLLEGINDTQMLAGVEALNAANKVYAQVKLAAKSDSSLDGIHAEMKRRYEKSGKKEEPNTPPTP
jgi:hypothetical protein